MEGNAIVDSSKIKEHNEKFFESLGNYRGVGQVPQIKEHNEKFLESIQTENVEKRLHLPRHVEPVPTIPTVSGTKEVISMEMDPLKLENVYVNPWSTVEDLSEFLNYCCPECDYKDRFEQSFSYHALQNHKNAAVFFASNKNKLSTAKLRTNKIESYDEYEGNQDYFEPEADNDFDDDWKNVEIKTENDAESYDPVIKSEKTKITQSVKSKKPFPCSLCNKSYRGKKGLKRHVEEFHEGKKPSPIIRSKESKKLINLTCEYCWIDFSTYKELLDHNKEKHISKDGKEMKCCIHCDHQTQKWANLQRHIDAKHPEHGEKKHDCDKCSERFIFNSSLTGHKRTVHMNFVCEICGASYTQSHAWRDHMILKHNTDKGNLLRGIDNKIVIQGDYQNLRLG